MKKKKIYQENNISLIENKNFDFEQEKISDKYNLPNQYEIEVNLLNSKENNSNYSEIYMFIPDKKSENNLREITEETNLNKDLKIYLKTNNDSLSNLDEKNLINIMEMKEYENKFNYFSEKIEDETYNSLMILIKKNLISYFNSNIDTLIRNFLFYFDSLKNKDIFENINPDNNIKRMKKSKNYNNQINLNKGNLYKFSNYAASTISNNIFNNEFNNGFSCSKESLKKLILKEKKEYFIEEIKKKVNIIKSDINNSINHLTIIIIGKSGVGKSTLINAIFKEKVAKTGGPEIQTTETTVYNTNANNPFFQLIDTRGIELKQEYGPEKIIENTINYINAQYNEEENYNNIIQSIWYYLTGATIEDKEIEIINKL